MSGIKKKKKNSQSLGHCPIRSTTDLRRSPGTLPLCGTAVLSLFALPGIPSLPPHSITLHSCIYQLWVARCALGLGLELGLDLDLDH